MRTARVQTFAAATAVEESPRPPPPAETAEVLLARRRPFGVRGRLDRRRGIMTHPVVPVPLSPAMYARTAERSAGQRAHRTSINGRYARVIAIANTSFDRVFFFFPFSRQPRRQCNARRATLP